MWARIPGFHGTNVGTVSENGKKMQLPPRVVTRPANQTNNSHGNSQVTVIESRSPPFYMHYINLLYDVSQRLVDLSYIDELPRVAQPMDSSTHAVPARSMNGVGGQWERDFAL